MTTQTLPPLPNGRHALFLDFDGTLAPIQDDPETVALPSDGAGVLQALAARLDGALCLISGRDVRDLSRRTPHAVWRAGGHGLEVCGPGEAPPHERASPPDGLLQGAEALAAALPGVRVEPKGPVLAIHYRAAPEHRTLLEQELVRLVAVHPGYSLQGGKMVFETKPEGAHKGRALLRLLGGTPFAGRVPVMVGDDTTDEDAMAGANRSGGWSVKVGPGESLATYRLNAPEDVWQWLRQAIA